MEKGVPDPTDHPEDPDGLRLAQRLRALRQARGWSLDALAERAGVSRATLSRIENHEVSPTANLLGRLGAAHGLSVSRLISPPEDDFAPLLRRDQQAVWREPGGHFIRRSVSPAAGPLRAEVLECTLAPATDIAYPQSPRPGLEHHLILLEGRLSLTVDGVGHALQAGDCLRYRLSGASRFQTPPTEGARYHLVIV